MKKRSRAKTTDGLALLERLTGDDPKLRSATEKVRLQFEVGQVVYDARTRAGLTQVQLARKVRTTQSVISRLEDADYGGHSLSMLRRIARALDLYVHITLEPLPTRRRRA
jgi:ribosome-binding protein aMBF1 (putative translation factor)